MFVAYFLQDAMIIYLRFFLIFLGLCLLRLFADGGYSKLDLILIFIHSYTLSFLDPPSVVESWVDIHLSRPLGTKTLSLWWMLSLTQVSLAFFPISFSPSLFNSKTTCQLQTLQATEKTNQRQQKTALHLQLRIKNVPDWK